MKTARVLLIALIVSLVSAVPLGVNAWPNLCSGALLALRQARIDLDQCGAAHGALNECLSEYATMIRAMDMVEHYCYYSE